MNIKDILSISGKPGLYKLVTTNKSSIIIEPLDQSKKIAVNAAGKISALADISIYTYEEDVPLQDVFQKIFDKENGGEAISHKSSGAELRKYMESVMPDYDEDRVYDSDLKKLFQWYNLLLKHGYIEAETPLVEDAEIIEETTEDKEN